tara:strand:+ start:2423 stop:3034 length:612 start_codon:yes stop_codon:yes gene_type:complete
MFYPVARLKEILKKPNFMQSKLNHTLIICALFLALTTLTISTQADEHQSRDLTTVYKVVGADGSTSFSDQPKAESETILVPPVATIPAITPGKPSLSSEVKANKPYNRYHSLEILAPADNSAFYSGSGDVDVLLDIQPALIDGDQIQIFLDGQLIQSNSDIQFRLQTISRGTHELQVKLVSDLGGVHKEAFSVFTVHRPSIRN